MKKWLCFCLCLYTHLCLAQSYDAVNPYVAGPLCNDVASGIKKYSGENEVYYRMRHDCGVTDVVAKIHGKVCNVEVKSSRGTVKFKLGIAKLNKNPQKAIYHHISCRKRRKWKICKGGAWQHDKFWCKWHKRPSGYPANYPG